MSCRDTGIGVTRNTGWPNDVREKLRRWIGQILRRIVGKRHVSARHLRGIEDGGADGESRADRDLEIRDVEVEMLVTERVVGITAFIVRAAILGFTIIRAVVGTTDAGLEISITTIGIADDDSLLDIYKSKIDGSLFGCLTKSSQGEDHESEHGKPSWHFISSQPRTGNWTISS